MMADINRIIWQILRTMINKNLKPISFDCTSYGELTFYEDRENAFLEKDYKELKSWCKNISTSIIYIWIDKKRISLNTSKVLMQLFFDLDHYQKNSKIVVQWKIDRGNQPILQTSNSFQNLFPHVSFIFQFE
jgi:hypothetical protein